MKTSYRRRVVAVGFLAVIAGLLVSAGIGAGILIAQSRQEAPSRRLSGNRSEKSDLNGPAREAHKKFQLAMESLRESRQSICPRSKALGAIIRPQIDEVDRDDSLTEDEKRAAIEKVREAHREEIEADRDKIESCIESHHAAWSKLELLGRKLRRSCMIPPPRLGAMGPGGPEHGHPPPPHRRPDFSKFTGPERKRLEEKLTSEACAKAIAAIKPG